MERVEAVRVVVLEDSRDADFDVSAQIQAASTFDVSTESDLDGVVAVLADSPVDCVICVHDPPAVDGIEVLTELRQDYPELPILVATHAQDAEEAVSRQATDILQLTDGRFDRSVVRNRIEQLAHRTRALGKYEQIFERANDGITIHDRESGDVLEANDRLYDMLGYDPGSTAELTLADLCSGEGDYTEAAARDLVEAAAEGQDQTTEWLATTADGDRRWLELSLEAVRIGGIERVLGFVRDITDRKANERLLRDREQQLSAVFDHPAAFAVVLDSAGRVVRANDPALEMTGLSASDVEGVPLWEAAWWPDGDEAERIRDRIQSAQHGEAEHLEVTIATEEGRRVIDLLIDTIPAADPDEPPRVVIVGYDVTQRVVQEAELEAARDRYERTLDRVDDAFFAVDEEWTITYVNDAGASALRDVMGLDPETPLLGRNLWRDIPDATDSPFYGQFHAALETGKSVVLQEYVEPLDAWFAVRAYPDDDGLSVYFTDVTERVERERELEVTETIVSNVGDGVYVLDESFNFVRVNDAYCRMTGYDRDDLLGSHCSLVVDEAVADDSADRMADIMADENATLEADLHRADGTTVRAESKFTAVSGPNGSEWKVGVVRDVSDRVERERELERVSDLLEQAERNADLGGWEVDVATEEVYWTDHLYDLLGVDDEVPSLDAALDVFLEADRPIIESAVQGAIEDRESFDVELRFEKTPDEIRWLRVQGTPIVEDGEVERLRGAAQDVTERKERERRMRALLDATRSLIDAEDESEIVDTLLETVSTVFGYDIATVRLYDPEAGTLEPTGFTDRARSELDVEPVGDDEGVLGEAFHSEQPLVVDDLDTQGSRDYGPVESGMVLPLGKHGVVGVGATTSDRFDPADAALLEVLALGATGAFDRLEREADTRRLRRTVEAVDEMVFLLDDDGTVAHVTDSVGEYVGVSTDALLGSSLGAHLTEETRDAFDRAVADLLEGRTADRTLEVAIRTDGGGRKPVELRLSTTDGDAGDLAIAGVAADISELAETRSSLATQLARFRELFENLSDPVVEVRFEGDAPIIEYANPAFTETFGYDVTSVQGENLNDLVVPDDAETEVDSRELGESGGGVDVRRETIDGPRDFLLRGIPYERDGQWYAFDIYTDITARKERERYHQILNRVLRHNLRNDMNVVMALANRLAGQIDDDDLAGKARTLYQKADEIAALSDKATDIERVLGSRGAEREAVDAVSYTEDVIADAREAHPDADIDVDLPAELSVMAGHELARVFEELVENALVHGSGTPELIVRADRSPIDGWVEIQFVDDGPGIPDDEWEIVTSESDISQLTHASGLGLWLARWITESYGGRLVRRADGDRTVVGVRLQRQESGSSGDPA